MMTQVKNNKGSGIAVIVYGVVFMLLLMFTTLNILNAKIIENAYNSLRDAVLAASSGSVMHLLTTNSASTNQQSNIINNPENKYDVYLQLALGYIINRQKSRDDTDSTIGVERNNFIKLDHKKVVNSTMALLDDAVIRNRTSGINVDIGDKERFKILMFFIEPYYDENYKKYFNIIYYNNTEYDKNSSEWSLDTQNAGKTIPLQITGNTMSDIYSTIEQTITNVVNDNTIFNEEGSMYFNINLNANGGNLDDLVRRMETVPYYLIVVKDFALPTLFDGVETNTEDNNIFTFLSGNGSLESPMCALNAGKTERENRDDK